MTELQTWAIQNHKLCSIRRSLDRWDFDHHVFGYEFAKEVCKRKRGGKWFTDDDVESTRALKRKMHEDEKATNDKRAKRREMEEARWDELKDKWAKSKAGGYVDERHYAFEFSHDVPGVFKVYQTYNNGYDTFSEFICVADSEGEARCLHPDRLKDACEYEKSEIERNEDWASSGRHGRAPGWFLGTGASWVHGAYVKVERISDYVVPRGEAPKYGIISRCFHAG